MSAVAPVTPIGALPVFTARQSALGRQPRWSTSDGRREWVGSACAMRTNVVHLVKALRTPTISNHEPAGPCPKSQRLTSPAPRRPPRPRAHVCPTWVDHIGLLSKRYLEKLSAREWGSRKHLQRRWENFQKSQVKVKTSDSNPASATTLARYLDVTTKTIAALAGAGIVKRLAHGKYDLEQSVVGYARHLKARERAPASESLTAERVRMLKLRADREQFEFERERRLWIEASEVERGLGAVAAYLRRTMLAIPSRIAGVDRRTMAEVDREIRLALTEVAQGKAYAGVSLPGLGDEGDGHGN